MISIEAFRRLGSANSWLALLDREFPGDLAPAIVDVLSGAPLSPATEAVWRELSTQPYPSHLVTTAANQSGRGSYKSSIGDVVLVDRLLRWDAGPFVAPGSEVVAVSYGPSKSAPSDSLRNSRPLYEDLARLLGGTLRKRAAGDAVEYVFEGIRGLTYVPVVRVGPMAEDTVRGPAFVAVHAQEAGWQRSGPKYQSTDRDMYTAVAPRLAQFPHGLFLMSSTNGPMGTLFHEWCEQTPPHVLKLGPLASFRVNPLMKEDDLRTRLSEEEFEQEVTCRSWGYRNAQFIRASSAAACIDADAETTPKGRRIIPAVVAVDVANVGDRIAFVVAYWIERTLSPGSVVRVLVVEEIVVWTPSRENPITTERIAEHAVNLSRAFGGCPIVADGRSFVDLSAHAEKRGAKVCRSSDDAERKAAIAAGGLVVVERGMHPKYQHDRWTTLRDAVHGGRLVLPDTREGHEAVRELAGLRATQMATSGNGFLRVEACSGETDDVADCLALAAECAFLRPPVRADGLRKVRNFELSKHGDEARAEWLLVDDRGNVIKRNVSPDVGHRDFAIWCVHQIAIGASDDEMDTFAKARLGIPEKQALRPGDYQRLVEQLVREGVVAREAAPVAFVLPEDPMERLKRTARRW